MYWINCSCYFVGGRHIPLEENSNKNSTIDFHIIKCKWIWNPKCKHRFGVIEHFLYHHVGFGYTLWLYMKFDIFILNIYKLYMDMYTCIYIVDGYE